MKSRYTLCASAGLLAIAGCKTVDPDPITEAITPLTRYVAEYKFSLFSPPRQTDGVGTIIEFDRSGQESVLAARETCLPANLIPSPPKDQQGVALLSGSYTIDQSNSFELGLSKTLTQNALGVPLDLGSTIGVSGVEKIEIEFINPFRDRIERVKARSVVRSMEESDACLEELKASGSLIIHTVIGAEGMRYKFVGEGGRNIAISAEILNALKAGNEYKDKWEGDLGFEVSGNLLVGYRTWKATQVSGAGAADVDLIELNAQQIESLRNSAADPMNVATYSLTGSVDRIDALSKK